ncbi:TetR/AcrR family transcriptional regulator [Chitinophaga vietnamensis]|uniref:TetR/AcrR family transcriptional regulator n=1 Tax=Chitinophaga vietnamensis TaxID=2593957 RepID=UPI0011774201|nr:TetR/AcrR family transcriptional regulator [Chitinophaga vietnamensis]
MRKKVVAKDTGTEQLIKDTARRMFYTEGRLHATLQDIADEIGVNRTLINYYFRSRDALFQQLYKDSIGCLSEKFEAMSHSDAPFKEKVGNLVEDILCEKIKYPFLDAFIVIEMNCKTFSHPEDYKVKQFRQFLQEVKQEMDKGAIYKTEPLNFMMDLLSLVTYPIIIAPLYKNMLNISDRNYQKIVADRKALILKRLFVK